MGKRSSLLLLGLWVASVGVASAQGLRKVGFSVMAGPAFAKFGGADVGEVDKTRVGLAVGLSAVVPVSPNFAVQPELWFVQKGGKAEGGGAEASVKLSYIQLPVLAKFRIPATGTRQISPHAYAGGALGFKVGCRLSVSGGGSTISGDCDEDPDSDVKGTDMSLVFGAGVDIGRAMVGIRYDLGLTKLDGSPEQNDIKNRTLYLLAGFLFHSPQ